MMKLLLYGFLIIAFYPITIPVFVIILIFIIVSKIKETANPPQFSISQVDAISDGHQFEYYIAEILRYNGYKNVEVTQASGDYGVDITADKDNCKYAIQCKLYSKKVGNSAVQEVVAGCTYYNCNYAVVVTNNFFTDSAIRLGNANEVWLWDRNDLIRMISSANKTANPTTTISCIVPDTPIQDDREYLTDIINKIIDYFSFNNIEIKIVDIYRNEKSFIYEFSTVEEPCSEDMMFSEENLKVYLESPSVKIVEHNFKTIKIEVFK